MSTSREAAWFHSMADLSGDLYLRIQIAPELRVEHLSGQLAEQLGLTGLQANENGSLQADSVDPRDAHLLDELLLMQPGDHRQEQLRWNLPDGRTLWTEEVIACRQRDDASVVVEGIVHDITGLKQAQAALATSERRHRLLVENAWDVIWTMGLDGAITYVSPAIQRVRGLTPEEAMVQPLEEIHPPADAAQTMEYFTALFTAIATGDELPTFHGEKQYYRKDGSIMFGELQVIPHIDEEGNVVEILGVSRDISDRKMYEQELRRMAVTDPLTGVWNRRHAEALLTADLAQARRTQSPLTVLMVDVDHFKHINDSFGHESGDRVLIEITEILREGLDAADTVSRWGGEEFVLVLRDCDLTTGRRIADELRKDVQSTTAHSGHPVTISVGGAPFKEQDVVSTLLDRADRALYEAKRAGRNQVAVVE